MLPQNFFADLAGALFTALATGIWTLFLSPLTAFTAEVLGFLDTLLPW